MGGARTVVLVAALLSAPVLAMACTSSDSLGLVGDQGAAASGTSTSGGGGECASLCAHIQQIQCKAWPSCDADCASMLGAPAACAPEFAAMLACWVAHESDFTCTQTQVVPPAECADLEAKFHDCVMGTVPANSDAGCVSQFWVCNSADTSCGCQTQCGPAELKIQCAEQGPSLTCACYTDEQFLGTCSQPSLPCDQYGGCCQAFFQNPAP